MSASAGENPPAALAIVGAGFRAELFLRIAQHLPSLFRVCGVVARRAAVGTAIEEKWGVPTFRTIDDLLGKTAPEFAVVSVTKGAAPPVITELASHRLPVLVETPPAADLPGLISLFRLVQGGAKIQVAEQYHLEPLISAQIAIAQSGRLGTLSQAFVSVCHDYHGISVLRRLLGIGFENALVTGHEFRAALQVGPGRYGDPVEDRMTQEVHTSARLDFGGRTGFYDFSSDQYRSWIRSPHVLVRGDRGELRDNELRFLEDFRTPMQESIHRIGAGHSGNHEGLFLRGLVAGGTWLYKNRFAPARLADDEIAVAALLAGMRDFARGGPEIYSLAEACQDQYLALVMQRAADTGQSIPTETQPWAPTGPQGPGAADGRPSQGIDAGVSP